MDIQKEIDSLKVKAGYDGKPQQWQYGFDLACRELAKNQAEKALLEQFEINNKLVEQIEKLKAQAVLEVKPSRSVTLTCAQLREAFMFGAPDKDDQEQLETEMTIAWSKNGHSGKGYYCYYSDLPEEGAIFLDDVIEAQEQSRD